MATRPRRDNLIQLAVILPAFAWFNMIYVCDLTLIDLGEFEVPTLEESTESFPFRFKGLLNNRIARIFFLACDLSPVVDKAITLDLD